MITSVSWIPKGVARSRPIKFELSSEEYERIRLLAEEEQLKQKEKISSIYIAEEHQDEEEQGDEGNEGGDNEDNEQEDIDISDLPSELNMDKYDDDEEDDDNDNNDNDDDIEDDDGNGFAVLPAGDGAFAFEEESEDEDAEDDEIRGTDTLLAVAMTEDEYSHLEIQLFTEDGTLYVHHDITLPDFPLCLSWLDCPPYQSESGSQSNIGNFMAVGTFNPAIEIWNLDVLDPLEPTATLGGEAPIKKKKGGKKKTSPQYKPGSHEGAVMGLAWNKTYRQMIASASADTTVKIWDVTTQVCSHTFNHHRDKVQSILWHPEESWLLASGSFDKTISLVDCRNGSLLSPISLPSDVECLAWDPFSTNHLYCSFEDGQVMAIDIRRLSDNSSGNKNRSNNQSILLQFQAHEKTVSSIDFSPNVSGLCATSSLDETVKIWDMHSPNNTPNQIKPKNVFYKTMNVGGLFSLNFAKDDSFLLATGGDGGIVAVWDCDEQQLIKDYFQDRKVSNINSVYSHLNQSNDLKIENIEDTSVNESMELVNNNNKSSGNNNNSSGNNTNNNTVASNDIKKKKKNKSKKEH